jgi:Domain of unknown function (DUF397)
MATQPNRNSIFVWRRSSASGPTGSCVEVARSQTSVLVRDSRGQPEAELAFSPDQWRGFVRRVKDGRVPLG